METNKLDKIIKQKLLERTFDPSVSAWERLSIKLDEQPKKRKNKTFFYIGIAASILLLVSLAIKLISFETKDILPKNETVISPINKNIIDDKIEQLINEIPVEKATVKLDRVEEKSKLSIVDDNKMNETKPKNKISEKEAPKELNIIIAKEYKNKILPDKKLLKEGNSERKSNILKQNPNSKIKVNSNDLLYAVTHSPEEVKKYYAKYNVSREDILKTIQNELKKSNLKVNPTTILAEVERTIEDDDFQNNFMKLLKKKVFDIATAIASRNN